MPIAGWRCTSPAQGWLEFDPTPPDTREQASGIMARLSDYADAAELYWNTYILIYDSGAQLQLFRSAQDTAQTIQSRFRNRAEDWLAARPDFHAAGLRIRRRNWATAAGSGRCWVSGHSGY